MIFTNGLLYEPSMKNGSIFTSGFIIQAVGGNQIHFYWWFVQQIVGENMCLSLFNLRVLLESGWQWGPHTHVSHRNLCRCKDMDRLAHQPLSLSHKPLSLLPRSLSLLLPLSPMEGDRPRHGWPSVAAWPWHDPGKWSSSAASGTLTRRPQAPWHNGT